MLQQTLSELRILFNINKLQEQKKNKSFLRGGYHDGHKKHRDHHGDARALMLKCQLL